MTYDRDSGHKSFLEDVFENESRLPGGSWGPSSVPWTDVVSVLLQHEPSVACPGGWTERFPPFPSHLKVLQRHDRMLRLIM